MAKPDGADKGSFDLDKFRRLLQLMEKHGVTEANLQKDGESWKVRRGPKQVAVAPDVTLPPPVVAAPAPASAAPVAAETPAKPAGITIDAPTVGTFYSSPTPEEPEFVNVGSTVQPDTTICIIEAMKVFNQIPAEKAGRIVEVLVANGDPVEFGQPLFRIESV
ncbi:MAG: acetyl-CoA carboxylase biotin carboxyl carrier protein [Fuerstiella sp.]|jgi:acetyl-CoA carboxylase biotin carboxyl carrier protein|nr:acetyl-CoA carboxylase biotin carboxyl carrier protein [Fuerstiella sp.]MDG2131282.1 acetyl-CoA carboxylase biotin carboxyl carrier protein [Fuerstiella sp.]